MSTALASSQRKGWPLPPSPLYELRQTTSAGRSVVARRAIAAGELILATSPPLSPVAHTIFRPYRREVCAWCFLYDRGRALPFRHLFASTACAFCSAACEGAWRDSTKSSGVAAFEALVTREKKLSRSKKPPGATDAFHDDRAGASADSTPSGDDLPGLLAAFESFGQTSKALRRGERPTGNLKEARKALASERPHLDGDDLRMLLSAVLFQRDQIDHSGGEASSLQGTDSAPPSQTLSTLDMSAVSPAIMALVSDNEVYKTRADLITNLESYIELVSVIPVELLPFGSASLCHEIVSRAAHNAFSIRPPGAQDGAQSGEYFGWGVWPEASFFNHSCSPNIAKLREGRIWTFTADRAIEAGDELCITYLGGDEEELDVEARQARLKEHWGFACACRRCLTEHLATSEERPAVN